MRTKSNLISRSFMSARNWLYPIIFLLAMTAAPSSAQELPDLVMTAVSGPATGATGGQITIANTAKNQGAGASGSFYVGLYLSTDATITQSDVWLGGRTVSSIAPGASNTAETSVTIPNHIAPGTYYIGSIADYGNNVTESDETNNALAGNQIYIGIDTTPPVGSVSINSGAAATKNAIVTLTLSATDSQSGVSQMQFSNDDLTWSAAESYATTKSWTLAAVDGPKTVYAKFKDVAGNWSSTYSDDIVLDTLSPTVSINPVTSPTTVTSQTITGSMESGASVAVTINTAATVGPVTYPTATTWTCTISGLASGANEITVNASDAAGNTATATASIAFVNDLAISNVTVNNNILDTAASVPAGIFFTLNGPATATLKIVPEKLGPTGTPVYQATQTIAAAGAHMFTWNGSDSAGKIVSDEAYLYILEATDGVTTATYSPAPPTGTGTVSCTGDDYDPFKNDPMTVNYSLTQAGRVKIDITWESQTFTVVSSLARAAGSYTFDWNGRSPSDKILPQTSNIVVACSATSLFGENHIVTTGDTPVISLLKTDPYEVQLSYGEFTLIKYTLSRDANVTVKLISPTGTGITLISSEPQTADVEQEVKWDGLDPGDTTGKAFLVSQEGTYTVSVQAVNAATGASATAKGLLLIRQ